MPCSNESPLPFQLEEKLLEFHLGNLEFSCAAPLSKVSSLSWDQNEEYPQFSGDHTLLKHGFGVLLSNLAQGLDIRLKYEVQKCNIIGTQFAIRGLKVTRNNDVLMRLNSSTQYITCISCNKQLNEANRSSITRI